MEQSGEELQEKLDSMVSGETVTVNPGITKAPVFNIDGDGTFVVQGSTQNPADTVLEGQILFGANSQNAEGKQLTLRNLTISADTIALKFNHSAPGVTAEGLTLVLENCVVEGNGTGSFGVLLGTGNRGSKLVLKNVKFVNLDTVLAIADSGNPQDYVSGATGNKVEMTNVTFENCNNQFQLFNPSVFYKDLADVIAKGDVERFNNVFTIDGTQVVPATEDAAANGAALLDAINTVPADTTIYLGSGTYTMPKSISLNKSVNLVGVPGETVVNTSAEGSPSASPRHIQVMANNIHVGISGICFVNATSPNSGLGIKQVATGYSFAISDCSFEGYTTSIQLFTAAGGTITGCTFNSGAVDISVSGQTGMVTISGNTYTPDKAENIGVLNADKGNLDIQDSNAAVVWY